MASRSASRTVMVFIFVPSGQSGLRSGSGVLTCSTADAAGASDFASAGAASALGASVFTSSALSPSSTRTAIGVFTLTPWDPSDTRILPKMPSSTASNSIVALSVSISAMMSPDLTASPSFFSHFASVPSSMVGDRAGIRISVAIRSTLPQACSSALPWGSSLA